MNIKMKNIQLSAGKLPGKNVIITISLLFCLNVNILYAQTGPFDGMCIIVVDARDSISNEQISGLKIYIADASGNVEMGNWPYPNGNSMLFFTPNPKETNPKWETCADPFMQIRYCFANENYIRVIECMHFKTKALYVHITDTLSSRENKYQAKIAEIKAENFYSLRENIGVWYRLGEMKETHLPDKPYNSEVKITLSRDVEK